MNENIERLNGMQNSLDILSKGALFLTPYEEKFISRIAEDLSEKYGEKTNVQFSSDEIFISNLQMIFSHIFDLEPVFLYLLSDIAADVESRMNTFFESEDSSQAFEGDSIAVVRQIREEINISDLNWYLSSELYDNQGFYSALNYFAKKYDLRILPLGDMAVDMLKTLPSDSIKRAVSTPEGVVDFYLVVDESSKTIRVFNKVNGYYVGSPIEWLRNSRA